MKWCYVWPHCACGIQKAAELTREGGRLLVYRNGAGDLKRVPCSEIMAYAMTEDLASDQFALDCPRTRGPIDATEDAAAS